MVKIEFGLEDLLQDPNRNLDVQQILRTRFRTWWEQQLPPTGQKYQQEKIAYNPEIAVELVPNTRGGLPYVLAITNPNRAKRPNGKEKKDEDANSHCAICLNNVEKGLMLFTEELGDYILTPNLFPIAPHHSLLLSERHIDQDNLTQRDLEMSMEFSFVFDQFLIYNQKNSGATIDHLHLQTLPYCFNGKVTPLHYLFNKYRGTVDDTFVLDEYPGQHRCFAANAQAAIDYIHEVVKQKHSYNVVVDKEMIAVIPRSESIAIDLTASKWAGLEMCGGIVLGDIKHKNGRVKTDASDLAKELTFDDYLAAFHSTLLEKDEGYIAGRIVC